MTYRVVALLTLLGGCPAVAQTPTKSPKSFQAEARRIGLAESVGSWKLAGYVPGEQAHFLYTSQKRAFSLFVSAMKPGADLKTQPGWRSVPLGKGRIGYMHQDSRSPERNALAWRHVAQRWMILGRLRADELAAIAVRL